MAEQVVYYGEDSLVYFHNIIKSFISKRVFLIRGKNSYTKCGAQDILGKIFSQNKIEIIEWNDFNKNPKLEEVERGLSLLRDSRASFTVAVGGGSVIDMAKLIRFAYSYQGDIIKGDLHKTNALLPLLALPTTAGTGCESTPFAVCYKDHVKFSVDHDDILPDYAFVYPPFTYQNSSYLTACAGFDALAQAIEAYWNVNATPESDGYAEKAIYMLWNNLPIAVNNPTKMVRDQMAKAANLAGKAIAITRTTAPHAFSYAFTSYCNYPHGHAVALTFPFFFSLNILERENITLRSEIDRNAYIKKIKHLRMILGLESCKNCMQYLKEYIEQIHLSCNGFGEQDINLLLTLVNTQRLGNNPTIIDKLQIQELNLFLRNSIH